MINSEQDLQSLVAIEVSKRGGRIFRNNVGVHLTDRGVPVRYGLANTSKQLNSVLKSSDLIGITPTVITPEMVGTTVGVFTSYEIKKPGWKYTGTDRETAQSAWIQLINSLGGIARFVSGLEQL